MYQLTFSDLFNDNYIKFFYTSSDFNKNFSVGTCFKFKKSGSVICVTDMCFDFDTFQARYINNVFFGDRSNYVFPKKWVFSLIEPI